MKEPARFKIDMLLCDYAQVAEGKLFVSGAGWNRTSSPATFGLAIMVHVPYDRANDRLKLIVALEDEEGQPGVLEADGSFEPLGGEWVFEVGRPPGQAKGEAMIAPFALNMQGVPLRADTGFAWRARIDGEPEDPHWRCSFRTRPAQ
jgi:hypothetical protein